MDEQTAQEVGPDLHDLFERINIKHFEGLLAAPELRWNSRLTSTAGRFCPPPRSFLFTKELPVIEIASYLIEETEATRLIADTLAHEMIHLWLWVRGRPYGHTKEFVKKMKEVGATMYNTTPKRRSFKYVYACESCGQEFFTRKRLGPRACASCCKKFNNGKYDRRFKLKLERQLD